MLLAERQGNLGGNVFMSSCFTQVLVDSCRPVEEAGVGADCFDLRDLPYLSKQPPA